MTTAVGYIRVSTTEQATKGVSLSAQRARIEAQAKVLGLNLHSLIRDAGESAASLKRAGVQELLERVRNNQAQAIIVTKLDRLTRSVRDLLHILDLVQKHGCRLISISETLDTETPIGRAVLTILGVVAQLEREMISERSRAAREYLRAAGLKYCRTPPYGYKWEPTGIAKERDRMLPDPEEQDIIRRIQKQRNRGSTLRAIAESLQASGCPSRAGKAWTARRVGRILLGPESQRRERQSAAGDKPKLHPRWGDVETRRKKARAMRAKGKTYAEIAKKLGYKSQASVHYAVREQR